MATLSFLQSGTYLTSNDILKSDNNNFFLALQTDGCLAVYSGKGQDDLKKIRIWCSYNPNAQNSSSFSSFFLSLPDTGQMMVFGVQSNGSQSRFCAIGRPSGNRSQFFMSLDNYGTILVTEGTPTKRGKLSWASVASYCLPPKSDPAEMVKLKKIWSEKADLPNMKIGESRMLYYLGNGNYVMGHGGGTNEKIVDTGTLKSGVMVTNNLLGPSYAVIAKASVMSAHSLDGTKPFEAVDVDIFSASARAEISKIYIGAGAELVLIDAQASIFDLKLGLSPETGFGIKDDSVTVKALGVGFQVGRKVNISVFGSSFGVDFGRLFS